MINDIMEGLEREGLQNTTADKELFNQILVKSGDWEVPEKTSQETIWSNLEASIRPEARTIVFEPWLKWAASIAIVAAIAISLFVISPEGATYTAQNIQEIELPDGSTVILDAGAELAYEQGFFGTREVTLEGKAFFDVAKGDEFIITTPTGDITVLGTSFNVNSFDDYLIVECFTGKVKVTVDDNEQLLTRGHSVKSSNGQLSDISDFNLETSKSWIDGEFYFQNSPLSVVFTEMERQYGIKINVRPDIKSRGFTGLFHNTDNVEEVLKSICVAMSLEYTKEDNGAFVITE